MTRTTATSQPDTNNAPIQNNLEDTICAIATASGGAIGVVRISGKCAIAIADSVFNGHRSLIDAAPNTVHHGRIASPIHANDGTPPIDDAMVSVFRAPHSYTGEDSVEISCHGSTYILQQINRLLCDQGCRQAEPGEFTKRAFLNGKIDLAQAEAVADLIASRTQAQHRMAMSQLRGTYSKEIDNLHDRLLRLTSLMELELDFSDHEELQFANRTELIDLCDEIEQAIKKLADSYATGNAIKEGVRIAIIGPTNVGKSTLLNTILHEERSIVSNTHGTTRDTVEDTHVWDGITFRFIDTAGLRKTKDAVEQIGIERTHQALSQAHIILFVLNIHTADQDINTIRHFFPQQSNSSCTTPSQQPVQSVASSTSEQQICPKPAALLLNKCDIISKTNHVENLSDLPTFRISAKTGAGLQEVQDWVCQIARNTLNIDTSATIVSSLRHYQTLSQTLPTFQRVRQSLTTALSTDLITQDLRDALQALATITHRTITPDTVLQSIFSHFCIGK